MPTPIPTLIMPTKKNGASSAWTVIIICAVVGGCAVVFLITAVVLRRRSRFQLRSVWTKSQKIHNGPVNSLSIDSTDDEHKDVDHNNTEDAVSEVNGIEMVPSLDPPTVLLVTTADAEMAAVLDRLENLQGYPESVGSFPVKIGKLGGRVVAVCKTEMGIIRTHRVVLDLLRSDYLKDSVKIVFSVGFAWGAKPESRGGVRGGNQRFGDVLVATKCIEAGHVRASDGDVEIRGTVKTSSLVDSVNSLLCEGWPDKSQTHFGQERIPDHRSTAHVGTVISLPTLLDDKELTEKIIGHPQVVPHKPIVGGDMELYQIADAADAAGKSWLFAKAICDFAGLDGAKNNDAQPLAAAAAADFVDWLLCHDVMTTFLS